MKKLPSPLRSQTMIIQTTKAGSSDGGGRQYLLGLSFTCFNDIVLSCYTASVGFFCYPWNLFCFGLYYVMHAMLWTFGKDGLTNNGGNIVLLNNCYLLSLATLLCWSDLSILKLVETSFYRGSFLWGDDQTMMMLILMHASSLLEDDFVFILGVIFILMIGTCWSCDLEVLFYIGYLMDLSNRINNRSWHILCWNVRGINSRDKWVAIRSKIQESNCDIICLQETKRENFDQSYLRNFCSPQYDRFEFNPSVGASGGTIII
jgi:hypothetical protein